MWCEAHFCLMIPYIDTNWYPWLEKKWEKEQRGEGKMGKGQDWHYSHTTPVTGFDVFHVLALTWYMFCQKSFLLQWSVIPSILALKQSFYNATLLKWDTIPSPCSMQKCSKVQLKLSSLTETNQVGIFILSCVVYTNTSNYQEVSHSKETLNENTKTKEAIIL